MERGIKCAVGGNFDQAVTRQHLTTSINEPRCRALLLDFLRIHDLIDQFVRVTNDDGRENSPARQSHELLLREVRQVLTSNGLVEIPTDGAFDPSLHRALRRVVTTDPARNNLIASVARQGFRTEQKAVLRYADVEVWYYQPAPQGDK